MGVQWGLQGQGAIIKDEGMDQDKKVRSLTCGRAEKKLTFVAFEYNKDTTLTRGH